MFTFKQIPFLKFDLMTLEKFDVFFPKRANLMMLLLVSEVFLDDFDVRIADRECTITFLPFKPIFGQAVVIDPFR